MNEERREGERKRQRKAISRFGHSVTFRHTRVRICPISGRARRRPKILSVQSPLCTQRVIVNCNSRSIMDHYGQLILSRALDEKHTNNIFIFVLYLYSLPFIRLSLSLVTVRVSSKEIEFIRTVIVVSETFFCIARPPLFFICFRISNYPSSSLPLFTSSFAFLFSALFPPFCFFPSRLPRTTISHALACVPPPRLLYTQLLLNTKYTSFTNITQQQSRRTRFKMSCNRILYMHRLFSTSHGLSIMFTKHVVICVCVCVV